MSNGNTRTSQFAKQRRSQRILLAIPVVVSGNRGKADAFSERTKTIVVNAHGGLIALAQMVQVGQGLALKNPATNEETSCTVVDISTGQQGGMEVGIAFAEANPRFWRVAFPPADWSPKSPEAKKFGPEIGSGKGEAEVVAKK